MTILTPFLILAQNSGPPADAAAGLCFLFFYLACMMFSVVLSLAALGFWVWMLVDCVSNEPNEGNDKIVWILIIVLTGWIGGLVYYFARRPQRIAKFGR